MTFEICKRLIAIKEFDEEEKIDLLNKFDVFLLNSRITDEEYNELLELLNAK